MSPAPCVRIFGSRFICFFTQNIFLPSIFCVSIYLICFISSRIIAQITTFWKWGGGKNKSKNFDSWRSLSIYGNCRRGTRLQKRFLNFEFFNYTFDQWLRQFFVHVPHYRHPSLLNYRVHNNYQELISIFHQYNFYCNHHNTHMLML